MDHVFGLTWNPDNANITNIDHAFVATLKLVVSCVTNGVASIRQR